MLLIYSVDVDLDESDNFDEDFRFTFIEISDLLEGKKVKRRK